MQMPMGRVRGNVERPRENGSWQEMKPNSCEKIGLMTHEEAPVWAGNPESQDLPVPDTPTGNVLSPHLLPGHGGKDGKHAGARWSQPAYHLDVHQPIPFIY